MQRSVRFFLLMVGVVSAAWASGDGEAHGGLTAAVVVNFLILAGALIYFLRKPAKAAQVEKHERISRAVREAEELRAQAETLLTSYQAKVDRLDREVRAILDQARREGEEERDRILRRAEESAVRIQEGARRSFEQEVEQMKRKLEQQALAEATARAAELLKERVKEQDHQALTAELIDRLEQTRV